MILENIFSKLAAYYEIQTFKIFHKLIFGKINCRILKNLTFEIFNFQCYIWWYVVVRIESINWANLIQKFKIMGKVL
jgi:hypothetical protein